MVTFTLGIIPSGPGRWTGQLRLIHETPDRIRPSQLSSFPEESLFPVFLVSVAPGVDEFLVLLVGDLIPVDEVITQLSDRRVRCLDPHHARRNAPGFIEDS